MMVEVTTSPSIVTPAASGGNGPSAGTYGRVIAWLSKRVDFALTPMDLTLPQYRVLAVLAEGSAAASGLADRLAVRPSSITAVIDGLVAKGFVDRKHEEGDRRRVALRLTDEGTSALAEANVVVDAYLASIAAHLPEDDAVMVLRSLELWGQALINFHQTRKRQ
jgi:long-chain acyl-CoA synthetase